MNNQEDLNKGEIYMIRNKLNGKCYIGQARKYVSKANHKWGTRGRWLSHLREAFGAEKDRCLLLNQALRKHKSENFEVVVLHECHVNDLDRFEEEFIDMYQTMKPHGYNMRKGGNGDFYRGQKISQSQLGNRRETRTRENNEDDCLPKYISAIRSHGVLLGYRISNFPVGVDKKEYINKNFHSKHNPELALIEAKKELTDLYTKYCSIKTYWDLADTERQNRLAILRNESKEAKEEYIYEIFHDLKICGYCVRGLYDKKGNTIPPRVFDQCQLNKWNLDRARKYVAHVKTLVTNNIHIEDWSEVDTVYKRDKEGIDTEHLPKYINTAKNYGVKAGYVVNGYPLPGGKKSCKKFTNSKFSMEERYQQALSYLDELKKEHPLE